MPAPTALRTTPPGRVRLAVLALAAALTLGVLAACSSDSGDSAPPDADPASTTTGEATAPGATPAPSTDAGAPLDRYADYQTVSYDDPTHWVCRPDLSDDICHGDLDSTTVAADGTLTVVPFERAEDPPVDCFYVYPTISTDDTTYSDWDASADEEGFVTLQQAARLASQCRVFAPVYRQRTLTGLTAALAGGEVEENEGDPFADVLDAFKTYMAEDNAGRGIVLIGHSQGAGMLSELLTSEFDPNPDVRAQLVGAYLAGGSVAVPAGEVVGGDFDEVPLCSTPDEAGCIVTWATFRSTAPPPANSFFGAPRDAAADVVSGCVNPAAIGGGETDLDAYFPADASASILSSLGASADGASWVDPSAGEITTPFVTLPGLVSGACASTDGFNYLSVTVHGDPADPRADDISGDLTPEWGLHLVDVNLVMGDVVARVGAQADSYDG